MRRVIGALALAWVVGCGGSVVQKKHADGAAGADANSPADHVGGASGAGGEAAGAGGATAGAGGGTAGAGGSDAGSVGDTRPSSDAAGATGMDAPAAETRVDASSEVTADAASEAASDAAPLDAEAAAPRLVTLAFAGSVVTVAGTPLGFDSTVRTMPVSGTFTYDANMLDDLPADSMRGKYQRGGMTAFSFTVSGHTVTGSGKALIETENLTSDTFRFRDGPQGDTVVRTMKLDGTDVPALTLFIAITDSSGALLTSDALPAPFPTIDITTKPHTFSLMDAGGTLLMQLTTFANQ